MPIYEYIAEDGEKLELLRSMADADKPVEDPQERGRTFKRTHSTFAAQGGQPGSAGSLSLGGGGCCPCGKGAGACSRTS